MATQVDRFDVRACLNAATAIEAGLVRLTAELTEAQFHAPPRTGGWSIGYCIEHLVLSGHAFIARWDKALANGTPGSAAGFDYNWWQRKLLQYTEGRTKMRRKTPDAFVPCSRHSKTKTLLLFRQMHHDLTARIARSEAFDARCTKVKSLSAPFFRYALGFSFDLALAHERRHLRQAWHVREQMLAEVEVTQYDT